MKTVCPICYEEVAALDYPKHRRSAYCQEALEVAREVRQGQVAKRRAGKKALRVAEAVEQAARKKPVYLVTAPVKVSSKVAGFPLADAGMGLYRSALMRRDKDGVVVTLAWIEGALESYVKRLAAKVRRVWSEQPDLRTNYVNSFVRSSEEEGRVRKVTIVKRRGCDSVRAERIVGIGEAGLLGKKRGTAEYNALLSALAWETWYGRSKKGPS